MQVRTKEFLITSKDPMFYLLYVFIFLPYITMIAWRASAADWLTLPSIDCSLLGNDIVVLCGITITGMALMTHKSVLKVCDILQVSDDYINREYWLNI